MNQRQSNFELLRIVAMLLVIYLHVAKGVLMAAAPHSLTYISGIILFNAARICIPLFVLLIGYFSWNREVKLGARIKRLLGPYAFYWVAATVLLIFTVSQLSPIGILLKQFQQLFSGKSWSYMGQIWYLYVLLGLIIVGPFINRLIDALDQKQHRRLIITLAILLSIIPTLNYLLETPLIYQVSSNDMLMLLPLFVMLYAIGGYIHRYDVQVKRSKLLAIFFGAWGVNSLLMYLYSTVHPGAHLMKLLTGYAIVGESAFNAQLNSGIYFQFSDYPSVLVLVMAVSIFLLFKGLHMKSSKVINGVAALTFGVYLNHLIFIDLIRDYVVDIRDVSDTLAPFLLIGISLLVYLCSGLTEALRMGVVRRLRRKAR